MRNLLQDLMVGIRLLRRHPAHACIAILALGLGAGLASTMFSVVQGTFFRALPFEHPEQIVRIERKDPATGSSQAAITAADFLSWREHQRSFEGLAAWYPVALNVSNPGNLPERYNGAYVTPEAFRLLRIAPFLGRNLQPPDALPGAAPVVLISHSVWQSRFQGAEKILGRLINVYGEARAIVGVLPPGLRFPYNQDLWLPLGFSADTSALTGLPLQVLGRLRPSVSSDAAAAELQSLSLRPRPGESQEAASRILVKRFEEAYSDPQSRATYLLMFAASLVVLLIACANVSALLLVRLSVRTEEIRTRTGLGAGRLRLFSQFLTEALALALPGAVLGFGLTVLGTAAWSRILESRPKAFWQEVAVDGRVLFFLLGVTAAAALLAGLIPAAQAAQLDRRGRGGSQRRSGLAGRLLVVAQIALSCSLLVAQALIVKSLLRLEAVDPGFSTEHLLTADLSLYGTDFPDSGSRMRAFGEIARRIAEIPGVEGVGLTSKLPGGGPTQKRFFIRQGVAYPSPEQQPLTQWVEVNPELFAILGIAPVRGRLFQASDQAGSLPVALVDESFVRRHFSGEDALGKRIALGDVWLTIVGIVPNIQMGGLDSLGEETVYLPLSQSLSNSLSIVLRTRGHAPSLLDQARRQVAQIAPQSPLHNVQSMAQFVAETGRPYRLAAGAISVAGISACYLALMGLYGIASFSVNRRIRDLALRLALGAPAGQALIWLMKREVATTLAGVALGLGLAAVCSRFLTSLLYRVESWDPLVAGTIAIALSAAALFAAWIPAKRVLANDPGVYLRQQ